MLTQSGCKSRRDRLWARLNPRPDALVIADPQHLVYFANYYQSPFVFRSNDAGAMLIATPDGKATLVADNLLVGFAEQAHVDEAITPIWYRGVESAPHREAFLYQNTLDVLKKKLTGSRVRLGIEQAGVPGGIATAFPSAELIDLDPHIFQMKRRKDEDELAVLRLSMKAGEAGFAAALTEVRPGMTEMDFFHLVCRAAMNAANRQAIVYGDFVTGPRTEAVGGPPSDRKIEKGDLVLLDFSTVIWQYRADFANTFVVEGKPSSRQQELAAACLEALEAGEKALKAGGTGQVVDRAVRGAFEAKHLEQNFPHHTGHGIGLGHPEPPFLTPKSSDNLLAGDVVTLEPGQYVAGIGGMRFERNYLITETGYVLLSKHRVGMN
jgi:Xaa-Pro aminopeptidase